MYSLFAGLTEASSDISAIKGTHIVYSAETVLNDVKILRSGEFGILLRQPDKQVNTVLTWPEINKIEYENTHDKKSVYCSWFNLCILTKPDRAYRDLKRIPDAEWIKKILII